MTNQTVFIIARKLRGDKNFHLEEYMYFQEHQFATDYLLRVNEANNYDIIELTVNPGFDPTSTPVINSLVSEFVYSNSEIVYNGPKYCPIKLLETVHGKDTSFHATYYLDTSTIGIEEGLKIATKAFMDHLLLTQYFTIDCVDTVFEEMELMYLDLESSFYYNRIYDNGELIGLLDSNSFQFFVPFIKGSDQDLKKHFIQTINQNTKIMQEINEVQANLKQRLEASGDY
jgi:hypothetical protein